MFVLVLNGRLLLTQFVQFIPVGFQFLLEPFNFFSLFQNCLPFNCLDLLQLLSILLTS